MNQWKQKTSGCNNFHFLIENLAKPQSTGLKTHTNEWHSMLRGEGVKATHVYTSPPGQCCEILMRIGKGGDVIRRIWHQDNLDECVCSDSSMQRGLQPGASAGGEAVVLASVS